MRFGSGTFGLAVAVLALLIGALTSNTEQDDRVATDPGPSLRRPPPILAPAGPALPPPSRGDPVVSIELEPKKNSSGTAFPVAAQVWMTARHVADGCAKVGIVTGPRKAVRGGDVRVHGSADLALFRAPVSARPVAVAGDDLRVGQAGYHFGFPQGEPGALRSSLLGRGTMRVSGRYNTREPVLAWAEVERVPDSDRPLSGISGGPVFDTAGQLVGVHVAGSIRRGRSYTTAPRSMRELWSEAGIQPSGGSPVPALDDRNFAEVGARLRDEMVVAKAICLTR